MSCSPKSDRALVSWVFVLTTCMCLSGCASLTSDGKQGSGAEQSVDVKFGFARMIERNGSHADARKLYEDILESNPIHGGALHRLGVIAVRLEEFGQAIDYFLEAESLGKPSAELLGDFGFAYLLSGDLSNAEAKLREALRIDPENERVVNNLAIVVGYQGKTEECLRLFRRVNSEPEAQSNLAFVLSRVGDIQAAQKHYHNALNQDPKLKKAAKGLAQIHERWLSLGIDLPENIE